jgi:hypothetical protein
MLRSSNRKQINKKKYDRKTKENWQNRTSEEEEEKPLESSRMFLKPIKNIKPAKTVAVPEC